MNKNDLNMKIKIQFQDKHEFLTSFHYILKYLSLIPNHCLCVITNITFVLNTV